MMIRFRNSFLIFLMALGSLAPNTFAENVEVFSLDMTLKGIDNFRPAEQMQAMAKGKPVAGHINTDRLDVTLHGSKIQLKGLVSFQPEFPQNSGDVYLALDVNGDGAIQKSEPQIRKQNVLSLRQGRKGTFNVGRNDNAVVYIEASTCPCLGKPYACSIRLNYKVSLVDKATGDVLWGDEEHEAIMANTCSFTAALGKEQPIPQAVLDSPPSELGVKLVTSGVEQIVPFYGALSGTGPMGPQGPAGAQGKTGPQGEKGDRGEPGLKGADGAAGAAGPKGDPGPKGEQGDRGLTGPIGPIGDQGPPGPKGEQGEKGIAGPAGPKGDAGDTGAQGPQGEQGVAGPAGPKGDAGDTGPQGPQGEQGVAGIQGPKGDQGDTGAQGPRGDVGPEGPKGDKGDPGPQGITGDAGPQGPKGPMGPAGLPGPQGPRGESGPPGSADILISGKNQKIIFNTPTYQGEGYEAAWIESSLAGKSDVGHKHPFTDITGEIPNCGATDQPVCRDGDLLKASGVLYTPAMMFNGKPIRHTVVQDLRLSQTIGEWVEIGEFDTTKVQIVSMNGTVFATDGVHLVANGGASLQVRITNGKVEEWHGEPTLSGRTLMLRVDYINL